MAAPRDLSDFDRGLVVGLLVAQGSFGGDGRQPTVVLKLHVRHERLVRRLAELFPASKVYGPYAHGEREYFQWMARGRALALEVLPVLEDADLAKLDAHAGERLRAMTDRSADVIARARARAERLA